MARSSAFSGVGLPEMKRQKCGHVAHIKKGNPCVRCRKMDNFKTAPFIVLRHANPLYEQAGLPAQ
jgi:hypothetical protein